MHFGVFSQGQGTEMEDFLGVAEISNIFFGVLEIPDFFCGGMNGRCWARDFV